MYSHTHFIDKKMKIRKKCKKKKKK